VRQIPSECDQSHAVLVLLNTGVLVFIQAYDFNALAESVDFINVMTYDYHGFWDGKTGHHSPLYAGEGEDGSDEFKYYNTVRAYFEVGGGGSATLGGGDKG
jgi:GH18 family chitinase